MASLNASQERDVRSIQEGAERMKEIIGNLTRFSRDDSFAIVPTAPRAPLEAALALFVLQFDKHHIRYSIRVPEQLPDVYIDASFAQQVFINLFANARDALVSLSPEYPRWLKLEIQDHQDAVHYVVRDNGVGVPDDIREQVFDPFFTTKAEDSGTGLGLALSRDIVERLGGSLELDPNDPATCFVVRIPTKPVEDRREPRAIRRR